MNINVFLTKLRENNNSEQNELYINQIERRLNKLIEYSELDYISVNDALLQIWHSTKDPEKKQFVVDALKYTDNEQFPEVQSRKMKIITHMRNKNTFDGDGKEGMNKAIEKLEEYKGSQFKLFVPIVKRSMPTGSSSFKEGYNTTIEFFLENTKNIKTELGVASKRMKDKMNDLSI